MEYTFNKKQTIFKNYSIILTMLNKQTFNKISKKYFPILKNKNLKNKNIKNKKLAICFSGVPGSGKTSIAKIIEDKYKAVRINKDEIGTVIRNLNLIENNNQKEDLSYKYINQLYQSIIIQLSFL